MRNNFYLNTFKQGIAGTCLLLIVVAFNNCGKVSFSGEQKILAGDYDAVQKVCANNLNQTMDVPVSFSDPGHLSCEYGQNGNLNEDDGLPNVTSFRGRIEQMQSFSLPPGAVLCGMEFAFADITMEYDDHFILSFDKAMLAASYDFSPYFEKNMGLNIYSWEKIKGVDWPVGPDPLNKIYCEGAQQNNSQCQWPQTQQFGKMDMRFSDQVFQRVFASNPKSSDHQFTLITIGDGDLNDCRIAPISFTAKVKYVQN